MVFPRGMVNDIGTPATNMVYGGTLSLMLLALSDYPSETTVSCSKSACTPVIAEVTGKISAHFKDIIQAVRSVLTTGALPINSAYYDGEVDESSNTKQKQSANFVRLGLQASLNEDFIKAFVQAVADLESRAASKGLKANPACVFSTEQISEAAAISMTATIMQNVHQAVDALAKLHISDRICIAHF